MPMPPPTHPKRGTTCQGDAGSRGPLSKQRRGERDLGLDLCCSGTCCVTVGTLNLSEPQFPQLGNGADNLHPTAVRAGSGQSPWHRALALTAHCYLSVRDDSRIGLAKGAGWHWGKGHRTEVQRIIPRMAGRNYSENGKRCQTRRTGKQPERGTGARGAHNSGLGRVPGRRGGFRACERGSAWRPQPRDTG